MRKHRSERWIGVITLVLMALGLIIIYAIGPMRVNVLNSTYGSDYTEQYFFIHQLISIAVAIVAFIVTFKVPYEKIRKVAVWILALGLGLSVALMILSWAGSSLASCQLGACRWINLGPLSLQPAEILKLGLVLYLAQIVAERKAKGEFGFKKAKEFWIKFGAVALLSLFMVVVVQSDLGTGLVILAIVLAILFAGGVPMKQFWLIIGGVALAGMLAIVSSPHRMERLMTFSGDGDSNSSYHIENALIAIGTGGMFGVGIGNSVQATGYLPESINDSVFAVMGETFGFIGLMLVVGLFAALLMKLLKVSEHLPSEESLVVVGIFAWVATHVVVNIMAMTGLIPLTGITLPLLSYGGTSLIMIAAGLGLTLQLSCYTGREVKNENISSRRGVGGTHYAGSRRRS